MADFMTAQAKVKLFEGGYQNNAKDGGNFVDGKLIGTNFGISAPTLKSYLGYTPTADQMRTLSYSTALDIYKNQYWNKIGGDKIQNQSVAEIIYDMAVNEGVSFAQKAVSDTLDISAGIPFSYTVTSTINSADQDNLFEDIKAYRKAHYDSLGGWAHSSWIKRLSELTFSDAVAYTKKNWVPISITLAAVATVIYLLVSHKDKVVKVLNTVKP